MNKYFCLIIVNLLIFISIPAAYAQRRMLNTKSASEIIRDTNPDIINSVGKIEGREVKKARDQYTNQYDSQNDQSYPEYPPKEVYIIKQDKEQSLIQTF